MNTFFTILSILGAIFGALLAMVAFSGCANYSPGAKVNVPITINASLTPAGPQILP